MLKRLVLLVNSFVVLTAVAAPSVAFAANCEKKTFLGIKPWYHYLQLEERTIGGESFCEVSYPKSSDNKVDVSRTIILVSLAVIDILMGIAGLVAFIFIVVSGFKFVLAQGDTGKEKSARESLFNAVIGLVIALVAIGVVSFIGNTLKG